MLYIFFFFFFFSVLLINIAESVFETGSVGLAETQKFLSHLLVAGCDIGVRFSVRPSVNIYIDVRLLCQVSILINYKTKQPSNLA